MVLAPGSFFTIAILDKIIMGILDLPTPKSKMPKGVFLRSRGFVLDLRGLCLTLHDGNRLKECKIIPRADFKIILAVLP